MITLGSYQFHESQGVVQPPATGVIPQVNQASAQFGAFLLPARPEPSTIALRGLFAEAATVANLRGLAGQKVTLSGMPVGFNGDVCVVDIRADAVPADSSDASIPSGWLVTCQATVYPIP
jgi:hypothetical protein